MRREIDFIMQLMTIESHDGIKELRNLIRYSDAIEDEHDINISVFSEIGKIFVRQQIVEQIIYSLLWMNQTIEEIEILPKSYSKSRIKFRMFGQYISSLRKATYIWKKEEITKLASAISKKRNSLAHKIIDTDISELETGFEEIEDAYKRIYTLYAKNLNQFLYRVSKCLEDVSSMLCISKSYESDIKYLERRIKKITSLDKISKDDKLYLYRTYFVHKLLVIYSIEGKVISLPTVMTYFFEYEEIIGHILSKGPYSTDQRNEESIFDHLSDSIPNMGVVLEGQYYNDY